MELQYGGKRQQNKNRAGKDDLPHIKCDMIKYLSIDGNCLLPYVAINAIQSIMDEFTHKNATPLDLHKYYFFPQSCIHEL